MEPDSLKDNLPRLALQQAAHVLLLAASRTQSHSCASQFITRHHRFAAACFLATLALISISTACVEAATA
jgi:hypothetical protein